MFWRWIDAMLWVLGMNLIVFAIAAALDVAFPFYLWIGIGIIAAQMAFPFREM